MIERLRNRAYVSGTLQTVELSKEERHFADGLPTLTATFPGSSGQYLGFTVRGPISGK